MNARTLTSLVALIAAATIASPTVAQEGGMNFGEEEVAPPPEEPQAEPMDDLDADSRTGPAEAEVAQTANADDDGPIYLRGGMAGAGIVVAPKLGVTFGQPFNEFGTAWVGELELGWIVLPFPDLQIFVNLAYQQPKTEGTGVDSRLPGDGSYSYTAIERQFVITPGLLYRLPMGPDWFRAYAAAGARFHLSKTNVTGSASSGTLEFGEYTETGTSIGGYAALGADFFVGPGSVLFEVQFSYAAVDRYVLQETNNGSLNLALGYRFFF